ncbi:MAG: hypothetical protein ACE5NG_04840 [bacterium]
MTAFVLILILTYYFLIKSFSLPGLFIVLAVLTVIIAFWLWQRPGRSEALEADKVLKAIGNGRSTFLNIYSNY